MNRRAIGVIATAGLAAGLLGSAGLTLARFSDADTVDGAFTTGTLAPPTDLAATRGSDVVLAWTPSSSGWASGYEVFRSATSGSGYASLGSVTPVTETGTTDDPANGTWYYVLRTTFHGWSSVRSNEASVVVGTVPVTTPVTHCDPASTAAETSDAGDNNGYETNTARACAQDGSYATDRNSGTSTTNSCTAATKDRHRFWGYAFGLPASLASVDGITVTPRVSQSNNGGTTWLCVQLSGDGGVTWTTPKQVVLASNALTTVTFGGAADTWGRTWAPGELDPAAFRVRLIDSSTQSAKDFELDSVGVSVTYTP